MLEQIERWFRNQLRERRRAKAMVARAVAKAEANAAEARGDDRRLGAARMVLAQKTIDELAASL